uniref:Uncharacterized protein n=1 Tax=Trichogramma kaykai TaxID=54128 RepID=A0ABD2WRZ5_9HYME
MHKNIDESSVVNESIAMEIEGSNKNIDESSVMNESVAMEIEESNKNIVESSVVNESIAMEIEESKQDRSSPMVIESKSNLVDLETQSGNTLQNVQFLNYIQARKPLKTKKLDKPQQVQEKKSKYLTKCPSTKIIHEQSSATNNLKEQLIGNEDPRRTKIIRRKAYKFGNSSTIDSISELIKFSYCLLLHVARMSTNEYEQEFQINKHSQDLTKILWVY